MKLQNSYFIPFLIVVAITFSIWAVYASFDHKEQLHKDFDQDLLTRDSLIIWKMSSLETEAKISILETIQKEKKPVALVFCASWSPNSEKVIELLDSNFKEDVSIIAAFVKDTKIDAIQMSNKWPSSILKLDAMDLYNELRAPGIPTTIFYNQQGQYLGSIVGYPNKAETLAKIELKIKNES